MPRRTADQRHLDSAPSPASASDPTADQLRPGATTADVLAALHHPVRRRLHDLLAGGGPATVGHLAARAGLAAGSASHHLKVMHRAGLIETAPELARDTRESWWRVVSSSMSWDVEDWPVGSVDREIAKAAERAHVDYEHEAQIAWLKHRAASGDDWGSAASMTSNYVSATRDQMRDLGERLNDVLADWTRDCKADQDQHPDAARRPIRVNTRVFPDVGGRR